MSITHKRNPVLLVHGLNDTYAVFRKMTAYLSESGWLVHGFSLKPNNGDANLEVLAQQVESYITRTFAPKQPVDLVGFSMGGLVSRYYVQRLGGINRVQRMITIASPHHGTLMANLSKRPGCVQMRRDSEFLQDLNKDVEILEQIRFTSIWTPKDLLMIIPGDSSKMPVGENVIVRPFAPHALLVSDRKTLEAVKTALSQPLTQKVESS